MNEIVDLLVFSLPWVLFSRDSSHEQLHLHFDKLF